MCYYLSCNGPLTVSYIVRNINVVVVVLTWMEMVHVRTYVEFSILLQTRQTAMQYQILRNGLHYCKYLVLNIWLQRLILVHSLTCQTSHAGMRNPVQLLYFSPGGIDLLWTVHNFPMFLEVRSFMLHYRSCCMILTIKFVRLGIEPIYKFITFKSFKLLE